MYILICVLGGIAFMHIGYGPKELYRGYQYTVLPNKRYTPYNILKNEIINDFEPISRGWKWIKRV